MNEGSVLYVFDDSATNGIDWVAGKSIVICPITTDYRQINTVCNEMKRAAASDVAVVNYAKRFNTKAFALRKPFTSFLADFASKPICHGQSLKRHIVDRSGKFSFWWLTPIAEKNTVATPAYNRLTAFLTILEIARSHGCVEIRLDIDDEPLERGLKSNGPKLGLDIIAWAHNPLSPAIHQVKGMLEAAIQLGKLWVKNFSSRWSMCRTAGVGGLAEAKYLIVTYFPFMDKQAWAQGRFNNKYFGPLQLELEKKYPGQSAWLAMFARFGKIGWRDGLRYGRQVDKIGYPLSFVEQWLNLRDLLSIALDTIRSAVKFAYCRRRLEQDFVFSDAGVRVNIWPFFEDDWYDSFSGRGLLLGLAYYRAFRNVVQRLVSGATIIYAAEMLAWEKALNLAAAERSDINIIGIQHTAVPLMLLTYSVDRSELNGAKGIDAMPAPNRLACVGPVVNDLLLSSGWGSDRVFPWAALRYSHFYDLLERPFIWSKRRRIVVLALPAPPSEARELLCYVWQALAESDVQVLIKAHPLCPVEPLVESLDLAILNTNFEISTEPLGEILMRAKAMIVSGSSASLESLACGCPVIIPRLASSIDRNALSGVSDLPIYVNSPMELTEIVQLIMTADRPLVSVKESRSFVKKYISLPDRDADWLTSFEEATAQCQRC